MHLSQRAFKLVTIALLSSPHIVSAAPKIDTQTLQPRGGIGSTPPPERKPDTFPEGKAEDLISWTDDDYTKEDYKNFPDYDPDQDNDDPDKKDPDKKKRSIDDSLYSRAPKPPLKKTTQWLRSVGVDGVEVRKGFLDSDDQVHISDTGDFGKKTTQLGIRYSRNEIPPPKPKPKNYVKWQADHVQDLGLYTEIAKQDAPDGIQDSTWKIVQETIRGEEDDEIEFPTANTKQLGKELNYPSNIRGINGIVNKCKNSIMEFAYRGKETKEDWTAWRRSTVWTLYRYMIGTKVQFDEITAKGTSTLADLIPDEDQGKKVAKHFKDEINRIYGRALTELERVLKDPPPANDKDSIFKKEDCSNTKDSPETPPKSDASTTDPTTPTIDPVNPPGKRNCIAAPTGPVQDAHEAATKLAAAYFCEKYADSTVNTANLEIAHTIKAGTRLYGRQSIATAWDYEGTDKEDDVYDISVMSVNNCNPDGGEYNLGKPVADHTCSDILHDAWKGCYNRGRGGALTAGCLVYSIATKY